MIAFLLGALLGVVSEVLVGLILWPVCRSILMILVTPYALIAALYDQAAYWPAVRERYGMTLISLGGFPAKP